MTKFIRKYAKVFAYKFTNGQFLSPSQDIEFNVKDAFCESIYDVRILLEAIKEFPPSAITKSVIDAQLNNRVVLDEWIDQAEKEIEKIIYKYLIEHL